MHEVALAQRIVEVATRAAEENGGGRITVIRMTIGALACVVPETLTFAFEIAARSTPAEGSSLAITRVPTRLRCQVCAHEADRDLFVACANCGDTGGEVLAGRELRLDTLDMEEDNPRAPTSQTA